MSERERVLEVEDKNSSQQRNVDQIVANKELFNICDSYFWSQSYQTFFFVKHTFYKFFASKLGHFCRDRIIFLCYKVKKNLRVEIEKQSLVGLTSRSSKHEIKR